MSSLHRLYSLYELFDNTVLHIESMESYIPLTSR